MEITNITKTYNARKGSTNVEWRIGQDGTMQSLTATVNSESGEFLGNISVSADGSVNAYARPGYALSSLGAELDEILAWIGDNPDAEPQTEEA